MKHPPHCFLLPGVLSAALLIGIVSVPASPKQGERKREKGESRTTQLSNYPITQHPTPNAQRPTPQELDTLYQQGIEAYQQGQPQAAVEAFQTGAEKARVAGDAQREFRFRLLLGELYSAQSRFVPAQEAFTRALSLAEQLNLPLWIAACLGNLGNVATSLGQLEKAMDYFTRALPLFEKLKNPPGIASTLNNLGNIYQKQGQLDKAEANLVRALEMRRQIGNPPDIAATLNNLGNVYGKQGRWNQAADSYTRAVEIKEKLNNPPSLAATLSNLGVVYINLGQYDKARDIFLRSLPILEKFASSQDIAVTLNNMGNLYEKRDEFDKAEAQLSRALALREQAGNESDIAETLNNLGNLYGRTHQLDKALAVYTRALAIKEKRGYTLDIAATLNNLGNIYEARKEREKAITTYKRALELRQQQGNPQDIATCLANLGNTYFSLNRRNQAEAAYAAALQQFETVGAQIGDATQLGAFQSANQGDLYARFALLLVQQHREAEALEMVERGRGQGLAKQAAQNRANLDSRLSKADATTLKRSIEQLTEATLRLRELQNRPVPPDMEIQRKQGEELNIARKRYDQAQRQWTQFRDSLYLRYPDYRRLQGAAPPSIALLHRLARQHPDTLFLEWALAEDNTVLLFALRGNKSQGKEGVQVFRYSGVQDNPHLGNREQTQSPNYPTTQLPNNPTPNTRTPEHLNTRTPSLRVFTLPIGRKDLTQKVSAWRAALTGQRAEDERRAARALYTALLGPVEKAGLFRGGHHLVCVADGALLDIPFAALLDGKGKRLVERFAISNAVSLGMLTWPLNRDEGRGMRDEKRPLRYATSKANPPMSRKFSHPSSLIPHPFSLLCAADPMGTGEEAERERQRMGLGALPAARKEAREVARLFSGALVLEGVKATEAEVKRQIGRYSLLHFATHGVADSRNGLRSFLALGVGQGEDGTLEAWEIAGMLLQARMAVLSACETGQGQKSGGEGLLGLAWAFRAAGCPAIVVSQWSVDDEATRKLMVAFYTALQAGRGKDEALRQAMLWVKKERPQPFYWAAFQVIGDTSVLPTSLLPRRKPR